MNTEQITPNYNPYGVVYIFREWHRKTPEQLAELLGWNTGEVEFAYKFYYERIASWVSAKGRLPNSEDIESGNFTLEPFQGIHYDAYLRL